MVSSSQLRTLNEKIIDLVKLFQTGGVEPDYMVEESYNKIYYHFSYIDRTGEKQWFHAQVHFKESDNFNIELKNIEFN